MPAGGEFIDGGQHSVVEFRPLETGPFIGLKLLDLFPDGQIKGR